ncbi:IclR family transcriptional regulator [Noviherbaspirillum saxi]|uniref:IclR family transcriptional regulator n=1 Tax=Noviherbaspirillum saxi TaxID=2320863 RepID=A0A3A3FKS0_9BURK|nr:IclR family transcriptional regulator [Noviherbaspirillum saxi]RJF91935.1 IclR family transcriptional regulator [Noviherbaspirillum saxi]
MADYTVDAVDKALGLLFLVAQQPGLGVTELAKRSGNTKARAFRLLETLEQGGLVQRELGNATYILGYKAFYLGAAASEQLSLARLAKRHLEEIGSCSNETVLIRIRDGLETVSIARWDSTHAVRIHSEIGNRRPLYVGASGKLLLAYAPADVQTKVLQGDMEKFTPNTITSPTKLKKELSKILTQGYAVSFAERTSDTVSIAAPVRDVSGEVIAAISITGPSTRMREEILPKLTDTILDGARRLSRELGYIE